MAQIEDNQYNALAQSGDNQNKWMAPQGHSPKVLADFFGRFMPRPLEFMVEFVFLVILANLIWIPFLIVHMVTDQRLFLKHLIAMYNLILILLMVWVIVMFYYYAVECDSILFCTNSSL